MSFIGGLTSLEKRGRLHTSLFRRYLETHWKYPETDNVSKIKAHDVHSMAASLVSKLGGASLNHILGACFWKSHSTFTDSC